MRRGLIVAVCAVAALAAVPFPSQALSDYVCQDQMTVGVDAIVAAAGPTCSIDVMCPPGATNGCDIDISGSAGGIGTVGVLIQTAGSAISTGCLGAASCAAPHRLGHIGAGETHTVYAQWSGAVGVNPIPSGLPAVAGLASIRVDVRLTP